MTHHNFIKTNSGFTLVETLVAISILLIAVVGPISLIGDALHKLYYARDEMVALNLAQEGIEVVRQIRDSNMLSGTGNTWNDLHSGARTENIVDSYLLATGSPANDVLNKCSGACESMVYFDNNNGLYRQGVSLGPTIITTQFSRVVTIDKYTGGTDEVIVTSTVTWKTGGDTGTVTVSENLFDLSP